MIPEELDAIRQRTTNQMRGPDKFGQLSAVESTGVGADVLTLLAEVEWLRGVLVMVREECIFGGDWEGAKRAIDRALGTAR